MADNTHLYGFRFHSWRSGPVSWLVRSVATGQDDTDDGAAHSVVLTKGDPVELVSTGGVGLVITQEAPWGIVMGVKQYWDGTTMRSGNVLPNQTVWGTVESRRSELFCLPAMAAYWEIDCDSIHTTATKAGYEALVGQNVEHTCPGVAWNSTYKADPYADVSVAATTHDFEWRIEGVSRTAENKDWTGNYVKLIVSCNRSQEAASPTTMHAGV